MKLPIKIAIISVVVLVVVAVTITGVLYLYGRRNILDGPGMVYSFRDSGLQGEWVCVSKDSDAKLKFSKNHIAFSDVYTKSGTVKYKVNDGYVSDTEVREIKILENGLDFYSLDYHVEDINGYNVPVISATVFEYDGRGKIVVDEFVQKENINRISDNYVSDYANKLNSAEPVKTYIEVDENE